MTLPRVTVEHYGAAGDGVTNDSGPFQNTVNFYGSGQTAPIIVPPGNYQLTSVITNNGRTPVYLCDPGATFTASDPNTRFEWPARLERWNGRVRVVQTAQNGSNRQDGAMHQFELVNNFGTLDATGYGKRMNYFSTAYRAGGYDIADAIIARWDRTAGHSGGQALAQWLVAASPQVGSAATRWGQFVAEWNVVNRHADHGWSKRRSTLDNWAGIFQCVPEGDTLGAPGVAYDVLFGIVLSRSSSNKASDGLPARMHNGILVEPDSITATGRAIYMSGRDTLDPAQTPVAAIELDNDWQRGISTRRATMTTGVALGLGATHAVAWLDGSDVVTNGIYSGTGTPEGVVTANVGSIFLRRDGGAGTTLYVKQTGTGNTGWVGK